jgi:hypothetical protein
MPPNMPALTMFMFALAHLLPACSPKLLLDAPLDALGVACPIVDGRQASHRSCDKTFLVSTTCVESWAVAREHLTQTVVDPCPAARPGGCTDFTVRWCNNTIYPSKGGCYRSEYAHTGLMAYEEYWFGFSLFLPRDYSVNVGAIHFQVHGNPNSDVHEAHRNPMFALATGTRSRNWTMHVRGDPRRNITYVNRTYEWDTAVDLGPMRLGEWEHFVYHTKFSFAADGFVELWRNGKSFAVPDTGTAYNDDEGPYFKFGIYEAGWGGKQGLHPPPADESTSTVIFGGLKQGDNSSSYAEVDTSHHISVKTDDYADRLSSEGYLDSSLQGTPDQIKVACIGDSITAGYLASSKSTTYPSVLQKMLGDNYSVTNLGHSGTTVQAGGDAPYWVTKNGAHQQDLPSPAALKTDNHLAPPPSRLPVLLIFAYFRTAQLWSKHSAAAKTDDDTRPSTVEPPSQHDMAIGTELAVVRGMLTRMLPAHVAWQFSLEIVPIPGWHTFPVRSTKTVASFQIAAGANGSIHVRGSDGVALSAGINHYLKRVCNSSFSWWGDSLDNLPNVGERLPAPPSPISKQTTLKWRFYMNCERPLPSSRLAPQTALIRTLTLTGTAWQIVCSATAPRTGTGRGGSVKSTGWRCLGLTY